MVRTIGSAALAAVGVRHEPARHRRSGASNRPSGRVGHPVVVRAGHGQICSGTGDERGCTYRCTPLRPRTAHQPYHPARLDQIDDCLSARDRQVLADIDQFHFLTGHHVRLLRYRDHTTTTAGARAARRTLNRLVALRVLGTLPRRVGGIRAGSSGLVYFVDVAGDRLLRRSDGNRPRRRIVEPSARFVDHTLAIADVVTTAIEASDQSDNVIAGYQCEPAAWRRYPGLGGGTVTLKPDLYIETAPADDNDLVSAHFVEIDLGGESIPTLLRKCRAYEQYRRSGSEQAAFGSFPQVHWSLTHRDPDRADRRRQQLRAAIERDQDLPAELFIVGRPVDITTLITKGGTP